LLHNNKATQKIKAGKSRAQKQALAPAKSPAFGGISGKQQVIPSPQKLIVFCHGHDRLTGHVARDTMPARPLIPFVSNLNFLSSGLVVGIVIGIHNYYVNYIMPGALVIVIVTAILRLTLKQ
jgi:hypothetical protein